ncbi:MAG: sugar phosphate isomerase/epimerase [Lachnospiraceae bacterium]|nr:sugar phosphate isomerase/epimerase [Lachnospiraceae bacterium]
MQIGLRLHDSEELLLDERLKAVRGRGFSCAHVVLSGLMGETAEAGALTPGYAMYLKKAFAGADIDFALLGCYLNPACPDKSIFDDIMQRYIAHIRFASFLGGVMVGTGTGAPNVRYEYDRDTCHSYEALTEFIRNLRVLVRYAEQMGVILAIEPAYKHIVWNAELARTVLDAVESPNLQVIFDPVNLLHGDNIDHRDEVTEQAIDLLGRDIAMIHLKDYTVKNDGSGDLSVCACGEGEMDYRAILAFAKEKKPHIQTILECTKPENAVQAREYIQKLYGAGTDINAAVKAGNDADGDENLIKIREALDENAPEEPLVVPANMVLTGCDACTFPLEGEAFTVAEVYLRGNEAWIRCREDESVIGLDCEYGFYHHMAKESVVLKAPFVIDVTDDKNLMGIVNTLATMFRILSRSMVQDPQEVCARIRDRANVNLEPKGITMRFTPQHLKFIQNKRFISLEEVVDIISGPGGEVVAEIVG